MRVNVAAAAGAATAVLLAAVGHAEHPAQVVVTLAASFAFLALLTRRGRVAQSDWFTVRVLLAGNLVVFGISYARRLGVALAVHRGHSRAGATDRRDLGPDAQATNQQARPMTRSASSS
jgi:hypothetical protein